MRIAIVGTGAMGSVYAGLFGSAGNDVWAIDTWAEHVAAIRDHGLRVEGASGDRVVRVGATCDSADAGVVDLVVIATSDHVRLRLRRASSSAWNRRTRDPERLGSADVAARCSATTASDRWRVASAHRSEARAVRHHGLSSSGSVSALGR
jgi:3-hydroxyacyl-CoA dehydrogenase